MSNATINHVTYDKCDFCQSSVTYLWQGILWQMNLSLKSLAQNCQRFNKKLYERENWFKIIQKIIKK